MQKASLLPAVADKLFCIIICRTQAVISKAYSLDKQKPDETQYALWTLPCIDVYNCLKKSLLQDLL